MRSTRSVGLLIDTVVCLTLAKWETVSGRFGGYLTGTPGASLRQLGLPSRHSAAGTVVFFLEPVAGITHSVERHSVGCGPLGRLCNRSKFVLTSILADFNSHVELVITDTQGARGAHLSRF